VPAVAGRLAGQAGTGVFHRLADRDLAAQIAALTGTRLVPVSRVPAQHVVPEEAGAAPPQAGTGFAVPLGTMPFPVVPADTLCGLGDDEFVLVNGLTAAQAGGAVTVLARCQAIAGLVPAQTNAPPRLHSGALARPGRPA